MSSPRSPKLRCIITTVELRWEITCGASHQQLRTTSHLQHPHHMAIVTEDTIEFVPHCSCVIHTSITIPRTTYLVHSMMRIHSNSTCNTQGDDVTFHIPMGTYFGMFFPQELVVVCNTSSEAKKLWDAIVTVMEPSTQAVDVSEDEVNTNKRSRSSSGDNYEEEEDSDSHNSSVLKEESNISAGTMNFTDEIKEESDISAGTMNFKEEIKEESVSHKLSVLDCTNSTFGSVSCVAGEYQRRLLGIQFPRNTINMKDWAPLHAE